LVPWHKVRLCSTCDLGRGKTKDQECANWVGEVFKLVPKGDL
jgi:hypothetical protein